MSEGTISCAYCGEESVRTVEDTLVHILECPKRPEHALLVKIDILETAGDVLLETIHSLVKALAGLEGMRSKSWEVYRFAKEKWEEVKNISVVDLVQLAKEGFENDTTK